MNSYTLRFTHAEWEAIASGLKQGEDPTSRSVLIKLGIAMEVASSFVTATNTKVQVNGQPSVALEPLTLSRREDVILDELTKGSSNKVIALRLCITESTVKVHMKSILRKLRLKSRVAAAVWALENGKGNGHDHASHQGN
jgi:DNA-binding NarL/FixJ family response regulator